MHPPSYKGYIFCMAIVKMDVLLSLVEIVFYLTAIVWIVRHWDE